MLTDFLGSKRKLFHQFLTIYNICLISLYCIIGNCNFWTLFSAFLRIKQKKKKKNHKWPLTFVYIASVHTTLPGVSNKFLVIFFLGLIIQIIEVQGHQFRNPKLTYVFITTLIDARKVQLILFLVLLWLSLVSVGSRSSPSSPQSRQYHVHNQLSGPILSSLARSPPLRRSPPPSDPTHQNTC